MRKLLMILAAAGMIFTACEGGSPDDETNGNPTEQPGGNGNGGTYEDPNSPLTGIKCANNEILYISTTCLPIAITNEDFNVRMVSNTYENGIGRFVFDGEVTNIPDNKFENNKKLEYIKLPNSITSIGRSAFSNCSGLTSITIGNSVTSIGGLAFDGCDSLTSVHITDLSAWCKIDFNYTDTNPLYYAKNLYLNGKLVTELTIPSDITEIKCKTFKGCSSLTSITIPDSVTSIGWQAFYNCSSLTSVTISNGVTSIGDDAFYDCSSLTSITIPNSVTSIGDSAFRYCSSLTSVTIGNGVTSIGNSAFDGCSGELIIESKIVENNYTYYNYPSQYGWLRGANFTKVIIGDSITSIGYFAFYGCSSLTSVTIPDSVTSIGSAAFYGCTGELIIDSNALGLYEGSFTKLTIGNSVTSIGYEAFSICGSLTSVTIGNSVTSIGSYAFHDCSSLTSITIPDSVTSIGEYAFEGCSSLTSVYCKPTTPPNGGSWMFDSNASDRKIYVPTASVSKYKSTEYWRDYYADYIVGYNF